METLEWIERQIENKESEFITLTDEQVDSLSGSDVEALVQTHGANVLLKLPPREQAFFDWLAEEDPDVWDDLWNDDHELLVALSYLPALQNKSRGFPICELEQNPNYYFTTKHITRDGMQQVPRVLELAQRGKELSIGEALLFDVMVAPIDIWRFCYNRGVPVAKAKETAHDLYQKNVLIHLTEREDLIRYLED